MTGAAFVLAINLAVAGLLGMAFLAIAVYDRARVSARWFALTYGLGVVYFALEALIPMLPGTRMAAYLAFAAALAAFNVGLARLYNAPVPWRLLAALLIAAVAVWPVVDSMERGSLVRLVLYQAPYAALQFAGAVIVWRWGPGLLPDRLLAGLNTLAGLHYVAKPLLARASGGVGPNPEAYINTLYALFSQSLGTVLGVAIALTLLVILVRDLIVEITVQSRTDKLSGLLNRRGFEEGRDEVMRRRSRNGLPVSLVLCDLDRFKGINDSYGHSVGDEVILTFAQLLKRVAAEHHVVGRVGGEEFAILLPGTNLAAARIMAEGIRMAYSAAVVPGISPETSLTASFGVAEASRGETAEDLFRRADHALYEAKSSGRNRVHCSFATHSGNGRAASA
jgi:diguanylate cyclase (GGDEF)-like protein